jgi:hypothetical protein
LIDDASDSWALAALARTTTLSADVASTSAVRFHRLDI